MEELNVVPKKEVLKLKNICKSFSDVQVLKDVNLTLYDGRILAICGENGAGKSTLMNILGGIYIPDSGSMYINEKEYTPKMPQHAIKNGVAFIHQELSLFQNLSVLQNFMIDDLPVNRLGVINTRVIRNSISENLGRFIENIDINKRVEEFVMGQKQLIEIAKELSKKAKIIIFDEPTTSLSNKEKELLFKIIREIRESGVNIIYISHILTDVMDLCDDILVLRNGEMAGGGATRDMTIDDIVRMMVGRSLTNLYPYAEKEAPGRTLLEVKTLSSGKVLNRVSFTLKEGEIVGLYGLMGAGRSEMARAVFGLDPFESGEIFIDGKEMRRPTPVKMKEKGVAFITENRREEGLLMPKPIADNVVLAFLKELCHGKWIIDKKFTDTESDRIIDQLRIKTYDKTKQKAQQLSGGNQQKLVIAKWLLTNPFVFILDEPTKGVDVGSKFEIYSEINNLALNRSAVLFISSEMEELMGVCDRILVMRAGEISGELRRGEFSNETILKYAIGGISE